MSYRKHPLASLGQINPQHAALARSGLVRFEAAIKPFKMAPDSPGLDQVPPRVRDAVTIEVPAGCGSIGALIEGVKFPVPGNYLLPGRLYVAVWPLLKKLNPDQQAVVEQAFIRRMNPAAADYPVPTTTPCDLGGRGAAACQCRTRKSPTSWILHRPRDFADSWEVQKCRSGKEKNEARSWMSFFNQLWGSQDLPFGYVEISGQPTFIYTVALNPRPNSELYNLDGTVKSGNLKANPPQLPQLPRNQVYTFARNALMGAMVTAGFARTDVAPSGFYEVDKLTSRVLNRPAEEFETAAKKEGTFTSRSLAWDPVRYASGKVAVSRNPELVESRLGADAKYFLMINSAIQEASAYGRDVTMLVWQSFAGLFLLAFTAPGTDSYAKSVNANANGQAEAFDKARMAILQSGTVEANLSQLAPQLLGNPNPVAAYQVVKELRSAFHKSIADIQAAQQMLPQAPQLVANVFAGIERAGLEIKQKLDSKLAQLTQRTAKLAQPLRTRLECKLIAKARGEQQIWPRKLLDNVPPLQAAIQGYSGVHSQGPTAIAHYQKSLLMLDDIEEQIGLSWWQKDYGPLPGWGWGLIGLGTFLGGAVYIRKKRKKSSAPKKNLRRRTSRR